MYLVASLINHRCKGANIAPSFLDCLLDTPFIATTKIFRGDELFFDYAATVKFPEDKKLSSFCFVLFYFVLFCFVLFCFVLFCFVLFCFVLFCFVCSVLFVCFFFSFVDVSNNLGSESEIFLHMDLFVEIAIVSKSSTCKMVLNNEVPNLCPFALQDQDFRNRLRVVFG